MAPPDPAAPGASAAPPACGDARGGPGGGRGGGLTTARFGWLLAVLIIAAFPGLVFGTHSLFHRDFGALAYPTMVFQREALWAGTLPFWNPLSHCGVPFLAQWGTMVLYPGNLFWWLLPLPWSVNVFCLAHLWLGGLGMFALASRWTRPSPGAAVAGVAFALGGPAQSCLLWPNYTVAIGWMPWVVLGLCRAAEQGRSALPKAGLLAGLQLLAGAPELTGLTWLAGLALALGERPSGRGGAGLPDDALLATGHGTRPARRVARVLAALGLALAVAAVQLLPFLQLLAGSQRAGLAVSDKWSLPVSGVVNFLAPLFRCEPTVQGTWFQPGQQFLGSVYLGAGVCALAAAGLCFGPRGRMPVRTLAMLALLGVLVAMGWGSLPGMPGWRYPVKGVFLVTLVVPLLAAWGCQARSLPAGGAGGRWWTLLGAVAAGGVLATLAWPSADAAAAAFRGMVVANVAVRVLCLAALLGVMGWAVRGHARAAAGVIVASLVLTLDYRTHLPNLVPTLPAALLRPAAEVEGAPGGGPDGRVFIPGTAEAVLLHSRVRDFTQDFVGKRLARWSNLNLLDGVAKVTGAATLRVREQAQFETALLTTTNATDLPVLDFLGVTRVSSPVNVTEWLVRSNALPLVTAGQTPVVVEAGAVLTRVLAPDFRPREEVFLTTSLPGWEAGRRSPGARVSGGDSSPGRVRFEVDSPVPTLAVVAQTFHPNWRAVVDGVPAVVVRANHAFQAVAVPAGRHRVELQYTEPGFWLGLGISVSTLAAAAVWLRRGRGRCDGPHRPVACAPAPPATATHDSVVNRGRAA